MDLSTLSISCQKCKLEIVIPENGKKKNLQILQLNIQQIQRAITERKKVLYGEEQEQEQVPVLEMAKDKPEPVVKKAQEKKKVEEEKKTNSKETVSGVFGIDNIGNTCYFASVMQCLNATECLASFYFSEKAGTLFSNGKSQVELFSFESEPQTRGGKNKVKNKRRQKEKKETSEVATIRINFNENFRDFLINARNSAEKCKASVNPSVFFHNVVHP